ncbi:hypothetical protein [Ruminococcus flavefaciens]|uniref:hypothetical protein n=1 Tax=Ruminococcus flavefaciens TaxID=1265 RepID=UPI00048D6B2C|nr:hypothetical protein [Ruminococcus flavefaciens]
MRKITGIAAFVSAVCLTASAMTGCGKENEDKKNRYVIVTEPTEATEATTELKAESYTIETTAPTTEAVTEEETTEYDPIDDPGYVNFKLSDDIKHFTMSCGGTVVKFPCTLAELYVTGWNRDDDGEGYFARGGCNIDPWHSEQLGELGENLKNCSYICFSPYYSREEKEEQLAELDFDWMKTLKSVDISRLTCYYGLNEDEIKLPKGIVIGKSTPEDVKAAYGEPDSIRSSDLEDAPSYYYSLLDEDGEKCAGVTIRFDGNTASEGYVDGAIWGVELEYYGYDDEEEEYEEEE